MSEAEKASGHNVVNNITNIDKRFDVDWVQLTWIIGAIAGCIVAATIVVSVAAFKTDRNAKMAEAITSGSHPMDVYCAFDGSSENKVCLVRASVSGKEVK